MIEYSLEDVGGNQFVLNGPAIEQPTRGSLTLSGESFNFDNDIIDNSSLPGSTLIGDVRLAATTIEISYTRVHDNTDDFLAAENLLMTWLKKTVAIRDRTNGRRLYVAISDVNIKYSDGGLKLASDTTLMFTVLKPFWENITAEQETDSLSVGINNIAFNNGGALDAYPFIHISTSVAVDDIQIFVVSTNHGISILDSQFGVGGYDDMYIDCNLGTLQIYDGVNYLDRLSKIVSGTGFFYLPPGGGTVRVIPSAACDIEIDWQERNYV